jgi:hypothetical protein
LIKSVVIAFGLAATMTAASAAEYECKVNCKGPDGATTVTVRADNASEAAKIVDREGHKVCKAAGHNRATDQTMSSSQCHKK